MPALLTRMSTRPKVRQGSGRHCAHAVGIGYVGTHGDCVGADLSKPCQCRIVRTQVGRDDTCAFPRERETEFIADAAGSTGDDGHAIPEFDGGFSCRIC